MFRNRYILKSISEMVTAASKQTLADLCHGWVEQEAAFTDRLIANIQNQLDGKMIEGIHWRAKTLTDRGQHAQETAFGADFLGILSLDLRGFRVTKGFFAQAKLARRRSAKSLSESQRLKDQCKKMLGVTPDSFVFVYSRRGIKILPASSVVGTLETDLRGLASRSIGRFFAEYVECFIGDPKLNAPHLDRFYALAEEYQMRQGLYVRGTDEGDLSERERPAHREAHAINHRATGETIHVDKELERDIEFQRPSEQQPMRIRI
ncbi:MAG: hypothetical protein JXQ75_22420 [Phycisphaerae bacterium]|nr:hypothetical protein [Phycisphaerae bacterium]